MIVSSDSSHSTVRPHLVAFQRRGGCDDLPPARPIVEAKCTTDALCSNCGSQMIEDPDGHADSYAESETEYDPDNFHLIFQEHLRRARAVAPAVLEAKSR